MDDKKFVVRIFDREEKSVAWQLGDPGDFTSGIDEAQRFTESIAVIRRDLLRMALPDRYEVAVEEAPEDDLPEDFGKDDLPEDFGKDDLCIWWLDQADCGAIGDAPSEWPLWLQREYQSRLGRNGRGRLWKARTIWPDVAPWPATRLSKYIGDECSAGGIVLPRELLPLLVELPGLVTDYDLRRLA